MKRTISGRRTRYSSGCGAFHAPYGLLRAALQHYERFHIGRVLEKYPNKKEAARRLRLGLSSLYRKIEELGIER